MPDTGETDILDLSGNGKGVALIEGQASDGAFDASWNGSDDIPTQNAIYDKIIAIEAVIAGLGSGGASVSDEVYGPSWNGSLIGASRNAIYDKIEAIESGGGSGVTDGDKGDVNVAGNVWTVQSADGAFVVDDRLTVTNGAAAAWNISNLGKAKGSLHFTNTPLTDNTGHAITFGAYTAGAEEAEAGIYTITSGGLGSRMYFATTNNYVGGPIPAVEIDHMGNVTIMRGGLYIIDEAYDATAWNGNLEVPTKNAIRDKLEALYDELYADVLAAVLASLNEEFPDDVNAELPQPIALLDVGQEVYPPEFVILNLGDNQEGDRIWIKKTDDPEGNTNPEYYSHLLTSADVEATPPVELDFGLSEIVAGTGHYRFYTGRDNERSADNDAIMHGPDNVAPVLSAAAIPTTNITSTGATVWVETDTAEGELYLVVSATNTRPTNVQIMAGQDHTGAAAVFADSQTVTTIGEHSFAANGGTAGTDYYPFWAQEDVEGNIGGYDGPSFETGAASPVVYHTTHAFDTQNVAFGSSSATFTSGSIGAANADRVCIACVASYDGGDDTPTGVTIGGVAATRIGTQQGHMSMWYAPVPTGTTANVVVTLSDNIGWCGCILESIIASNEVPLSPSIDPWPGDGTNPSVTPTIPTDGLAIAFAAKDNTGVSASWTNATADAFKANLVWSLGTARRSTAGATPITAGGWGGTQNGLIVGVWQP